LFVALNSAASNARRAPIFLTGRWQKALVFDRGQLRPGDRFEGPAIVAEASSTSVIDPGWQAEVLSQGELLVRRSALKEGTGSEPSDNLSAETVMREVPVPLFQPVRARKLPRGRPGNRRNAFAQPVAGRPDPARDFQSAIRRHRRADGDHAPQHGDQRQRQGAA